WRSADARARARCRRRHGRLRQLARGRALVRREARAGRARWLRRDARLTDAPQTRGPKEGTEEALSVEARSGAEAEGQCSTTREGQCSTTREGGTDAWSACDTQGI